MGIDRREFEAFEARQRHLSRAFWLSLTGIAVGGGWLIGEVASFVIGFVFAVLLPLIGYEIHRRWNRARWLRRFPELERAEFAWKQR